MQVHVYRYPQTTKSLREVVVADCKTRVYQELNIMFSSSSQTERDRC